MGILSTAVFDLFTQTYVAIWISVCNEEMQPVIARLSGVRRLNDENLIECFIPCKLGQPLIDVLKPQWPVAILAASTRNFESYQVKGRFVEKRNVNEQETQMQIENIRAFAECVADLGLPTEQCDRAYNDVEFVAITLAIEAVYDQSPKVGAGFKIN